MVTGATATTLITILHFIPTTMATPLCLTSAELGEFGLSFTTATAGKRSSKADTNKKSPAMCRAFFI